MAMISCTYDTVAKKMVTSIDGKEVDAEYCTFYNYCGCEGESRPSITIELKPSKNDGMVSHQVIRACADLKDQTVKTYASEDKTLAQIENKEKNIKAVANWLSGK